MSNHERTHLSRRAYLAAGATGVTLLAGCPSQDDPATETDDGGGRGDLGGNQPGNQPGQFGAEEDASAILVNQVGYRPGDENVAVVTTEAESFEVLDESDEVVAEGELGDAIEDANSGDTVRRVDLGDVTDPGTYELAVDDEAESSREFTVEDGAWGQVLANVCRGYTLKRAGTEIDDDVVGVSYGPGHTHDAEAKMWFGDEFHEQDEALDVSGGWYDAGDYNKYVPSTAVTVGQLLLAYERNPDTFEVGQFEIDAALAEGGDGDGDLPDLLREARVGLEWLAKMQRPDGALYLKVGGTNWPEPDIYPSDDEQDRYIYGLSTYGTAEAAGAMALAARVYADHDQAFADRMLANAEAAWGYLADNPSPQFREDNGQDDGSNAYKKEGDAEERLWAAAELFKTTGDSSYADYVENEQATLLTAEPAYVDVYDASALGQWAYYSADGGDDGLQSDVEDAFVSYADALLDHVESEGYNVALAEDEYTWYSNRFALGKANLLILANEMQPNDAYLAAARDQIHYVLGRAPTDTTYVTAAGEEFPRFPHDRVRLAVDEHIPGFVVGGPNADGGDPTLDGFIDEQDPAPAKAYRDEPVSWASNETGILNSAPLVFALAHFTPADAVEPWVDDDLEVTVEGPQE